MEKQKNDALLNKMKSKENQQRLNELIEASMEIIRNEIDRIRLAAGYSRKDMSELLGFNLQRFTSQTSGASQISAELLLRFCYVFDYDIKKIAYKINEEEHNESTSDKVES